MSFWYLQFSPKKIEKNSTLLMVRWFRNVFLVSLISSKKRTKTCRILGKKWIHLFVFLEEFTACQFAYEINWPFDKEILQFLDLKPANDKQERIIMRAYSKISTPEEAVIHKRLNSEYWMKIKQFMFIQKKKEKKRIEKKGLSQEVVVLLKNWLAFSFLLRTWDPILEKWRDTMWSKHFWRGDII